MKSILILAVNGSPHDQGIVSELLSLVLQGAEKEGAETKTVDLYNLVTVREPGYYSEDAKKEVPEQMPKDDIVALYPEIMRADALVLGTPVYWANMSSAMKDFIEHLTALENSESPLEGKLAAFIAASKENEGGVEMAAISMVAALTQMGFLIPPNAVMWYPGRWITSKRTIESWAKHDAPNVGRTMVKLIRLLREKPIKWSGS